MSIISTIDKKLAVIYSSLMPIKFINELLDRGFKFIEVPEENLNLWVVMVNCFSKTMYNS